MLVSPAKFHSRRHARHFPTNDGKSSGKWTRVWRISTTSWLSTRDLRLSFNMKSFSARLNFTRSPVEMLFLFPFNSIQLKQIMGKTFFFSRNWLRESDGTRKGIKWKGDFLSFKHCLAFRQQIEVPVQGRTTIFSHLFSSGERKMIFLLRKMDKTSPWGGILRRSGEEIGKSSRRRSVSRLDHASRNSWTIDWKDFLLIKTVSQKHFAESSEEKPACWQKKLKSNKSSIEGRHVSRWVDCQRDFQRFRVGSSFEGFSI